MSCRPRKCKWTQPKVITVDGEVEALMLDPELVADVTKGHERRLRVKRAKEIVACYNRSNSSYLIDVLEEYMERLSV